MLPSLAAGYKQHGRLDSGPSLKTVPERVPPPHPPSLSCRSVALHHHRAQSVLHNVNGDLVACATRDIRYDPSSIRCLVISQRHVNSIRQAVPL